MAEYEFEGPDGKTYVFEGPDPAKAGLVDQMSGMVTPEVPKQSMLKSLGESLLPPGIAVDQNGPSLNIESAKRALTPIAGRYGLGAAIESAGAKVEEAVRPAFDAPQDWVMGSKLGQAYPQATAAAMTLPGLILDSMPGALRASSAQLNSAPAAAGPIGEMLEDVAKTYGKVVHRIPKDATARAANNPAIMKEDFINPSRLDSIASGFKKALDYAKSKANDAFDRFFSKTSKAKQAGTADPSPITQAIDKGAEKMGAKVTPEGEIVAKKGTETKMSSAELAEINEIKTKFAEDLKGTKTRKLTANKLHNQRQYIDSKIDWKGKSDFYNKTLQNIRGTIDDVIRKEYPEVKTLDKEVIKVKRAENIAKRRTGIKPGREEIGDAELQKTMRLAKTLETPGNEVIGRELDRRMGAIGGERAVDELRDVAASSAFNRAIETNSPLLYKGATALSRMGLKDMIKASFMLPKYTTPGMILPGLIGDKDKKRKK